MNRRSRYRGRSCFHCHRPVKDGQAALASTYYVRPTSKRPWVSSQSRGRFGADWDNDVAELELRIVYHRACIEQILTRTPLDPEDELAQFNEYRHKLLVRYGLAPEAEAADDEAV